MLSRILFCCFALLLCASLPAQKGKERVKNRAENRANNNVDRKVDKAVDEAFNAVGNLFKKKNKKSNDQPATETTTGASSQEADEQQATANAMQAFGFGNSDFEPYTNEKSFSIVMHTTEIKKNGKRNSAVMHVGVLPTQIVMKVDAEEGGTRTLFDTETGKTTLVSTDKKGRTEATRMRMPSFGRAAMEDAMEEINDNFTYEVTGETRTIDGYPCKKVIARDGESGNVTEGWVTEAVELSYLDIFGGIAAMFAGGNTKKLREKMPAPPMEGLMIEGTTTEPNGTVTTVKLTDIKMGAAHVDRSLFDLTGIPVQDIGL